MLKEGGSAKRGSQPVGGERGDSWSKRKMQRGARKGEKRGKSRRAEQVYMFLWPPLCWVEC